MAINWSILIATGLGAAVSGYMLMGEFVVGGVGANENSPQPPALRLEDTQSEGTRVRASIHNASSRIATLVVRGRTEADTEVMVASETSGRVVERPIELGQRVREGDLLCRLDVGARAARLAEAEASFEQAQADFEAASRLNQDGFAADIRVKTAKAAMDAADAEIEETRVELERTEIRSPIDGVVESNMAEVGDMLAAGGTCAMVMNADPMMVIGQVSERQIGALRVGMTAHVKLVTGELVDGQITYMANSADSATRTFRVEIELPNSDGRLRAGVTAEASIDLPAVQAHLFSPAFITLSDAGQIGVRIVDGESRAQFVPLQIIGSTPDGIWAIGLPDQVTIITVGQEFVTDGEQVVPIIEDTIADPTANAEQQPAPSEVQS